VKSLYEDSQLLLKCDKAIDDAMSGRLSVSGFQNWLSTTAAYLEPRALAVRESCDDPDFISGFPIAQQNAISGLASCEEGLEECYRYLESSENEHLSLAKRLIREGLTMLKQAYESTLDTSETLTIDGRF
jgi:hypothetical protein